MKTSIQEIKSSVTYTNSALFAAITEIISYDVTTAARLFERRLIHDLQDIDRAQLPVDYDYLAENALRYVTTVISSSLALRSYKKGIILRPNVMRNIHVPAYLHQVLSGVGEVMYELQGVRRVVDYSIEDESDLMSDEEIKNYSSVLSSYSKHSSIVLTTGIPMESEGDHKRMSLIQVVKGDSVHMASNEACPIVDAQEMACLYPKLFNAKGEEMVSSRIPAVIDHMEINDLVRKNGFDPRVVFTNLGDSNGTNS